MHQPVADPDLNDTDRTILGALSAGRNAPRNLADEAGQSRQYVHQRLKILEAADYVVNVGNGVYELQPDELPDDVAADLPLTDVADSDRVRELEAALAECREELQAARETASVDAQAALAALNDLEGALERGERHAAEQALQRAREALDDDS